MALDDKDPQPGDIFVLFLMARDPAGGGRIDEIAIGIIDANYESFVFYETVEDFIAEYIEEPAQTLAPPIPVDHPGTLIKLKATPRPFKPPEIPDGAEEGQREETT